MTRGKLQGVVADLPSFPSGLRIIVAGLVGLHPVGGVAWDYLQYVIGLAMLGHDVYYYEDTWTWPYQPIARSTTHDPAYSVDFIERFFRTHAPALSQRWRYVHLHDRGFGVDDKRWNDVIASADVFLNVSGASIVPEQLRESCLTVFVDTDPGYNQIVLTERPLWSENVDRWERSVRSHNRHFTYAENIHSADCAVPLAGLDWTTTRMPIVTELWSDIPNPSPGSPWTTVMTWNAFKGPLLLDGVEYGSKGAAFEELMDLPARTSQRLLIALGGTGAPIERLTRAGWDVVDGPTATLSPADYQTFVARSVGEISVAKEVYVALRTGWFSCRSACYLAAGRPVIVQDTGFAAHVPPGDGLWAFDHVEDAVDGVEHFSANLGRHSRAARDIAQEYFSAPRVLSKLIEDIGSIAAPTKSA